MRIGILTGGGDVPGLNPCIKALVNGAERRGWSVLGIRRGWAGLLNVRLDEPLETQREWAEPLNSQGVRTIDRSGGTYLHPSRTNPAKVRRSDMPAFLAPSYPIAEGRAEADCTAHVLKALQHLGIDALAPIGGDDTLSYAVRLHREGVPVRHPKTMDNDVFGTNYCIGFSTAVNRRKFTVAAKPRRIAVINCSGATMARRHSCPATSPTPIGLISQCVRHRTFGQVDHGRPFPAIELCRGGPLGKARMRTILSSARTEGYLRAQEARQHRDNRGTSVDA
jgi:hypothetical protein